MKAPMLRTLLAVMVLATPAFAQLTGKLQVRVPFDFQVGAAQLSAGTYMIDTIGNPTIVRLLSHQVAGAPQMKANAAMAITVPGSTGTWQEPNVAFRCYPNDRCFIASIVSGMSGVEFRRGHAEIVTSTLMASAPPKIVLLAARRLLP